MEKVRTGIHGLDHMLMGGLPKGKNILISGPCGSGKTTMAMQFILNGIQQHKEPGLYLTLEQEKEKIRVDMFSLGFDLKKHEKKGKLVLLGGKLAAVRENMEKSGAKTENILEELREVIQDRKIKRVAIDSLNLFVMFQKDNDERRKIIAKLSNLLSELNCTAMLITEIPEGSEQLSTYGVEEFVLDGVIRLLRIKERNRLINLINIVKMRGTDHDKEVKMYEIGNKGINVIDYESVEEIE